MKKKIILIIFLSFSHGIWAQESAKLTDQNKSELKKLSDDFTIANQESEKQKQELVKFKNSISESSNPATVNKELTTLLQKNNKLTRSLDSIYGLYMSYKKIYLSKKIPEADINAVFNHTYTPSNIEKTEDIPNTKTYLYFGKGKVIEEKDSLFKDQTANIIFGDILNAKSEAYLGDFTIPQNEQKIPYIYYTRECGFLKKKYKKNSKHYLKFKSIKIHLFEGSLYDIKMIVTDDQNKEYLFENQHPVSLLRYSVKNYKRYLYCNPINIDNTLSEINGEIITKKNGEKTKKQNNLLYYQISLSDVLSYIPNPGNNYVPEDEVLEFPTLVKDVATNKDQPVKYKLIADTALQNIVEFRTYTDFLGLFTETPNGIIQLEGKGDFYVAPFNLNNTSLYFAKKISPFVNFSRIDKEIRTLTVDPNSDSIKKPLEIIEKSYLQMGLNVNVVSLKLAKEYPFDMSLYGTTRYQISDIMNINNVIENYKSVGIGGGLSLEFKRYNNFGFIYSADFTQYNSRNFNDIEGVENPKNFWVFQNKAEIYYFPGETRNQSIFLRFKTFNDSTKGNDDAFYQLQFGYKFSIGLGKIKH